MQSHPVNAENVKQAIDEAATIIAAWGGQVKRKESYSWVLDHAKKSEKTVLSCPPLHVKSCTNRYVFFFAILCIITVLT